MRIAAIRLRNVRCFEDTGDVVLSSKCNIFVGQNNSGKSTLLKGVMGWQLSPLQAEDDVRHGAQHSSVEIVITGVKDTDYIRQKPASGSTLSYTVNLRGNTPSRTDVPSIVTHSESLFRNDWPNNFIVPFFAKRKASHFDEHINSTAQSSLTGTFSTLYARIDRVASPGPAAHDFYKEAITRIVGTFITTKASPNGKIGGYYFSEDKFVTLDRMGDGVSEIVALIVDLSLSSGKTFVLEEPETNLHPTGLKALLDLIRESSIRNQFIIATHSNVVVRELAADDRTKVFRVFRDGESPSDPSQILEVERTPTAHMELLRELGYEFGDFDLHEGWLFLEEASAEYIVRDILIPFFEPELRGRLRTFSAGGVDNIEPTISQFQRLITFVHLEAVYRDRMWVRADGDEAGQRIIEALRRKFEYLTEQRAATFSKSQFEMFYPDQFRAEIDAALAIPDKRKRTAAKFALREQVVTWTAENPDEARTAWATSAAEQIILLKEIARALRSGRKAAKLPKDTAS